MKSDFITPPQKLARMFTGPWLFQAIYVAAKLNLADFIREEAQSLDDIFENVEADKDALFRLLRCLAAAGIFRENEDGKFISTPLSELLRSDSPSSMKAEAIFCGEEVYQSWGKLLDTIRTGKNAFESHYGQPLFSYFTQHEEASRNFDQAMSRLTRINAAVAAHYDFSSVGTLVDVGCGQGELLTSIMEKYPDMHGVFFDRPQVMEGAKALARQKGVNERSRFIGGSFFDFIPKGGDNYLLKCVLHNYDDGQAIAILQKIKAVLPPKGKALIVDMLIPDGPHEGTLYDLNMMVLAGGRERREEEFGNLFEEAGLKPHGIISFPFSTMSLIEGIKP